jgi:hypothetical protein
VQCGRRKPPPSGAVGFWSAPVSGGRHSQPLQFLAPRPMVTLRTAAAGNRRVCRVGAKAAAHTLSARAGLVQAPAGGSHLCFPWPARVGILMPVNTREAECITSWSRPTHNGLAPQGVLVILRLAAPSRCARLTANVMPRAIELASLPTAVKISRAAFLASLFFSVTYCPSLALRALALRRPLIAAAVPGPLDALCVDLRHVFSRCRPGTRC